MDSMTIAVMEHRLLHMTEGERKAFTGTSPERLQGYKDESAVIRRLLEEAISPNNG